LRADLQTNGPGDVKVKKKRNQGVGGKKERPSLSKKKGLTEQGGEEKIETKQSEKPPLETCRRKEKKNR